MSEQEVNHAENIVQIISRKDDEIRQLKSNMVEAVGDRDDREKELAETVRTVTSLRLNARKKDRQHENEVTGLKERIQEITGQCNDLFTQNQQLTADLKSVNKKQKTPAVDADFVLHLIMCEGVKQLGNMVHAAAHAFTNLQKNNINIVLHKALVIDYVGKQPSLLRTVNRYVSSVSGTLPPKSDLSDLIDQFVTDNVNLFVKDIDYVALRDAHALMAKASNARTSGQTNSLAAFASISSWLPLLGGQFDSNTHESDATYIEAFADSVVVICRHLIAENF